MNWPVVQSRTCRTFCYSRTYTHTCLITLKMLYLEKGLYVSHHFCTFLSNSSFVVSVLINYVFLVLCHVFGVGRYHHEQILKRYEQSKPTFTSSSKNIVSLSGENRTIILFRPDSQLWLPAVMLRLKSHLCHWNAFEIGKITMSGRSALWPRYICWSDITVITFLS